MARVLYGDRRCRRRCPGSAVAVEPGGFTLIELLVTIIIIGTLAAIALPSFLNQTAKAKQAGALKYVGVVNRSQQMYFLEHTQFASSFGDLGFRPDTAPSGYTFTFSIDGGVMSQTRAVPQSAMLRGYAGVAFARVDAQGTARVDTLICQGSVNSTPSPTLVESGGEKQVADCDTY